MSSETRLALLLRRLRTRFPSLSFLGGPARWLVLSSVVGAIAALGAMAFYTLSHALFEFFLGDLAGFSPPRPRGEIGAGASGMAFDYAAPGIHPLWCVLLPALGGLVTGVLVSRFAPEAKGHGTDAAVAAYHRKRGVIAPSVIWVKTLASALTLATGGSGGREGPIAQIGAGFGSWLGGILGLSARERRILLACGMGAGVSAIFRAPLAGALFAAEILYRDVELETEVVMPAIVSAIVSYTLYTIPFGQVSLFATDAGPNFHHFVFSSPIELVFYSLLGLVLVVLIRVYIRVFYGVEEFFERLPFRPWIKPMVGGLLTGSLALGLWAASGDGRALSLLSFGYSAIQEGLDFVSPKDGAPSAVPWGIAGMLGLVAVGKIVATSLTIGSGGSAGVFGPSMVIGGAGGTALGIVCHFQWPEAAPHPGCFAIVGMAGFFSGAAHVPISTLIMVSELTGNYGLVLPAMLVEAITFTLCRDVSLYRSQVQGRKDSPAHRGEFLVDLLEGIRVRDLAEHLRPPATVPSTLALRRLLEVVRETRTHYFPVLSEEGRLAGILSINDLRPYLNDVAVWDLMIAADIMTTPVSTVAPDDDLNTALRRVTDRNIDEIPVVDDAGTLLGMLSRRDLIAIYNRRRTAAVEDARAHG